ncbi:hypothetical protein EYC84_002355 [Monilinia fructicola]|uniref:Heterokaryon incompatibility domain-containing protein n=1 Tax=Monilinia fructicola TaxID=38448 RepID=A0A5M9JMR3_MONFR|nr:hypothetical protein EYC84_002355 [Monilinia fructicola]
MTPPDAPHQYGALAEPSAIRILQGSLSPDSQRLCGHFAPVSLDADPAVRMACLALSYCWGVAGGGDEVWFDGHRCLRVKRSAGCVLRVIAASRRAADSETLFVWIDAVCIDQGDDVEKARQVRRMSRIYSSAMWVCAWIGDASLDSGLAVDFVARLRVLMDTLVSQKREINCLSVTSTLGFEEASLGWKALANLLDRPWFSRMWVVQEVALGHGAQLLCGQRVLSWRVLGLVVRLMVTMGLAKLLSRHDGSYPRCMAQAPVVYDLKMSRENGRSLTLEHSLFLCITFLATDPRDKIYALFGLATDIEELGINVDYNASVKEVYTDTTIKILNQGTSLSLLNAAGAGRYRHGQPITNDNELPSWVPNLAQLHDLDIIAVPASLASYKTPEASHPTKPQIQTISPRPDSPSLQIRGRCISRLSAIYPLNPDARPIPAHNHAETQVQCRGELAWLHETMASASRLEPYPSGVPWRHAYARTLIINKVAPVLPAAQTPREAPYWESLDAFLDAKRWVVRADVDEVRRREAAGEELGFDGGEEGLERARKFAAGVADFRGRLFETGDGFLGNGHGGVEVGDEVCLFYGGQTPFVVREVAKNEGGAEGESSGSQYVLVGECYVDGWMDGW